MLNKQVTSKRHAGIMAYPGQFIMYGLILKTEKYARLLFVGCEGKKYYDSTTHKGKIKEIAQKGSKSIQAMFNADRNSKLLNSIYATLIN